MAWTTPKTWAVGDIMTAADMNTYVRDNMNASLPIGTVADYCDTADPADTRWLIGDGRLISRTTYADAFALWGTTFSAGDGSTTFGIPNLQDRVTVGKSGTKALGSTGGAETVTLTLSQIPVHDHALQVDTLARDGSAVARGGLAATVDKGGGGANGPVKNAGGGGSHTNMQPYMALAKIVKVL